MKSSLYCDCLTSTDGSLKLLWGCLRLPLDWDSSLSFGLKRGRKEGRPSFTPWLHHWSNLPIQILKPPRWGNLSIFLPFFLYDLPIDFPISSNEIQRFSETRAAANHQLIIATFSASIDNHLFWRWRQRLWSPFPTGCEGSFGTWTIQRWRLWSWVEFVHAASRTNPGGHLDTYWSHITEASYLVGWCPQKLAKKYCWAAKTNSSRWP